MTHPLAPRLAGLTAPVRDFGSDNRAPMCPAALGALTAANATPRSDSYGEDAWSERARRCVSDLIGGAESVTWVPTGTAANIVALGSVRPGPGAGVLVAHDAHVLVDEAGALERVWGTPLVPVASPDGKIRAEALREVLSRLAANHPFSPDPGVVSLTVPSESGRSYSLDEIAELAEIAHAAGASVILDGARFANALAGRPELAGVFSAGVDALVLGGTKNGSGSCEAVVCARPDAGRYARRAAKQIGAVCSKSRLLAAPVVGCLEAGCYLDHAAAANATAASLAERLGALGVDLWRDVDANLVFALLDDDLGAALDTWSHNSRWAPGVVRFACAWDHNERDLDALCGGIAALLD